jgi:predicted dehydrogenase
MLKVGVLGVGHSGKLHISNWKDLDNIEVTGFFDPNNFTATEVEKEFQLHRFLDVDSLIDACDLIDINTPAGFYFEICEKAIRKGKHVFLEKTLANSIDEAKELVKLVKESNIKLQVGFIERFNAAFLLLQQLHLNPVFIEIIHTTTFNPLNTSINIVEDMMTRDIDIILSIVKSDVKNINATGVAVISDTPDIVNARIEFNNGCVANITVSKVAENETQQMRFYQPETFVDIDFLNKKIEVLKQPVAQNSDSEKIIKKDIPVPGVNAIKMELEEFRNAILNNTPPIVTAIDGFRAMDIAHHILQKIKRTH